MSGEVDELAEILKTAFNSGDRVTHHKLVRHILRHQFVRAGGSAQLFRVLVGTGMGMISSGDFADFVLYVLVELGFLLLPSVRERFHIRAYFRFKDDLFVIAGGPEWSRRALFNVMQVKARFSKLVLDSSSPLQARFLDLEVSKGVRWRSVGSLDYRVVVKTTSLGIVLSDSSAHHRSVHGTWPCAVFNRIALRSSSRHFRIASQKHFVSKFDRDCPAHAVLPELKSQLQFQHSLESSSKDRPPACRSWICIPYHRAWQTAGVGGNVSRVQGSWQPFLNDFIELYRVGVSWSLGGRHLFRVFKGINH